MILYAVYFNVRIPVSYRDLEETMAERGVDLDLATLTRAADNVINQLIEQIDRTISQNLQSVSHETSKLNRSLRFCDPFQIRRFAQGHPHCVCSSHAAVR